MFSNGSGFCQPCEAGMRQASYGQAACEFCPPGFAPRDDAKYCSYCSRGTYAAAGDASCRPCEPGSYQRDTGQTFCEVCPAGFTTDEDRTACNRCQAGTFSKDSLTGCQTCGGFTAPNEQQTNCIPSWAKLAGAVVFTFFAAFFMWLLPFFVGIKRHIADVSWLPTDEAVILTTRQKHQFSSKYIPVVFRDTGVSWLQESTESTTEDGKTKSAPTISSSSSSSSSTSTSSIMYVKKTSPTQLQIYTEPGCPLAKRAETSIGTFRPTPLAEAFGSVFLGIPVVLWMGVSIAGMIAMALLIHIPWWYYIATFVFDFFVVLALRLLQRRHDAATPLQALLDSYKAKVMTNPTPCGPGPLRSVNVGKLCKFEEHFRPILQRRSMYYVCPNLVKPLTKEKEVSFAEFVGCDLVDWFISHFWGLPFCDFILSLQQHAKHHAENWEDVRYWICTFSNNQWKMDEEIPRDAPPTESSFFKALTSPTCLGTGMMMDVDVTPLKRSWCLFEMLHTFRQRDHTQERPIAFQGLLMLTPQGVLNTGRGSLDTALRIGQRLTTLKLEEATAAEIADKEKIDAEVRAQEGGFPAINAKLRSEICQVLEQMASTFTEDLSELARQLRERELSPTCNETSPLEVHVADDDPVRPKPWQQRPSAAFGAELTKWAKFRTSEGSGEDP
ncbi:EGF and pentraxin domain-containing protein 1 [Durusdinium trenchii]|uniref:EGF and pentraxin domain-containing protein 1 n=1 Tax=Durusdinium trenchii TaxID=1381693 RepID=A0ABP0MKA9_9DINO